MVMIKMTNKIKTFFHSLWRDILEFWYFHIAIHCHKKDKNELWQKSLYDMFMVDKVSNDAELMYNLEVGSSVVYLLEDGTWEFIDIVCEDELILPLQKSKITEKQILDALRLIMKNNAAINKGKVYTGIITGEKKDWGFLRQFYIYGLQNTLLIPEPKSFGRIVETTNGYGMFILPYKMKLIK
jgi:hypothetical protein